MNYLFLLSWIFRPAALLLGAILLLPVAARAETRLQLENIQVAQYTGFTRAQARGVATFFVCSGGRSNGFYALRCTTLKAVDGAGMSIADVTNLRKGIGLFQTAIDDSGSFSGRTRFWIVFGKPAASARSIREISGTVQFYIPENDPRGAVLTVSNLQLSSSRPLRDAALESRRLKIFLKPASGGGLADVADGQLPGSDKGAILRVSPPFAAIMDVRLVEASGAPIPESSNKRDGDSFVLLYDRPLPRDARLLVYLITPAALQEQRFQFTNLLLP